LTVAAARLVGQTYEITIDNVSTMAAYRGQFNKTMNEAATPNWYVNSSRNNQPLLRDNLF